MMKHPQAERSGRTRFVAVAGLVLVGLTLPASAVKAEEAPATVPADHAQRMQAGQELFKSQVREILTQRCLDCHGGKKTEADFNLATREGLLKGGATGSVLELGKAGESLLMKLVRHNEEPHMPYELPKLPDVEIEHLARWIELGAPYDMPLVEHKSGKQGRPHVTDQDRQFWSFQPLRVIAPPLVKNQARCRTPIDRFVVARQETVGLHSNEIADRRLLIRRVALDLTGLPPTPEEINAFIADPSPDAYEKLLDRLLDSPHYGERWGRHWLDLARFAESHGYEQDYDRPAAYHFRDFVIQALNSDMPYDRFVRLQIAGDEFEPDSPLAMMATGFLGAGTHATQITANQVEKERYDELDDMTSTVGTAMLGLTIGCARCHDHKFDPIPTNDYYRILSTFTTTVRSEVDLDLHPERYLQAKAKFDSDHAPLAAALKLFEESELPTRLDQWLATHHEIPQRQWLVVEPKTATSAGEATFTLQPDGSYLVAGPNRDDDVYTFVIDTPLAGITALRIEALADATLPKSGPGRAENGNFALSDVDVKFAPADAPDNQSPVKLVQAHATFEQVSLPVAATIDDNPKTSWAVDPEFGKHHAAVFEFGSPHGSSAGSVIKVTLSFRGNKQHNIGRPRLSISTAPSPPPTDGQQQSHNLVAAAVNAIKIPAGERGHAQRDALNRWYRTIDADWLRLSEAVIEHSRTEPKPELTKVMVTSEGLKPIRFHTQGADFFDKSYILKRGDLSQKQAEATQSFLQVLMRSPDGEKHWQSPAPVGGRTSYRRMALVNWLVDIDHGAGALAARVAVNRLWQHHFGRGLVSTPSDFGAQGEKPSHPELLEWLAAQLVENGWRLKPLHKLMMTSAVYMQAVDADPKRAQIDPENLLLWHRNRQRLEAETLRDAMLVASDSLDRTMFGPGTLDEGQHRRSIYYTIKRSQLIPLMILFDGPDSLTGLGSRSTTTIAPQALALLNNVHLQSYARALADHLAPVASQSLSQAINGAYLRTLGRDPDAEERAEVTRFIEAQGASYLASGHADGMTLAFADICQALMSLNEFVYVE